MLVHRWPLFHRNDGFGRGRVVAQYTVWPFGIVVLPPSLNQDLCFLQAIEDLTVQELIAKACVEALTIATLSHWLRQ